MYNKNLDARIDAVREKWQLTRRECDVLRILAREGASNLNICLELGIKECTVEQYISSLLRKSGTLKRTELLVRFWSEDLHDAGADPPPRRRR